jgi:hypothetical protein
MQILQRTLKFLIDSFQIFPFLPPLQGVATHSLGAVSSLYTQHAKDQARPLRQHALHDLFPTALLSEFL